MDTKVYWVTMINPENGESFCINYYSELYKELDEAGYIVDFGDEE